MADTKTKEVTVSPATAGQVDFSRQVNDFQALIDEEVKIKKAISEISNEIVKLSTPDCSIYSGIGLSSIQVWQKVKIDEKLENVLRFDNLSDSIRQVVRSRGVEALVALIGKDAVAKLTEVSDLYASNRQVLDKKATEELRSKYSKLNTQYREAQYKLQAIGEQKQSAKEYVNYVKDVASIATAAKRLAE